MVGGRAVAGLGCRPSVLSRHLGGGARRRSGQAGCSGPLRRPQVILQAAPALRLSAVGRSLGEPGSLSLAAPLRAFPPFPCLPSLPLWSSLVLRPPPIPLWGGGSTPGKDMLCLGGRSPLCPRPELGRSQTLPPRPPSRVPFRSPPAAAVAPGVVCVWRGGVRGACARVLGAALRGRMKEPGPPPSLPPSRSPWAPSLVACCLLLLLPPSPPSLSWGRRIGSERPRLRWATRGDALRRPLARSGRPQPPSLSYRGGGSAPSDPGSSPGRSGGRSPPSLARERPSQPHPPPSLPSD